MTASNEDAPGKRYFTPTKADTGVDANGPFRGIYIGGSGNVKITDYYGNAVVFTALATGVVHPIGGVLVWDNGTTATGIVCVSSNDHSPS